MPAAKKSITLQEDKPSLRVTSAAARAAPFLRKQSDFAFLEVLNPSEIVLFHEISPSDVPWVRLLKFLRGGVFAVHVFVCGWEVGNKKPPVLVRAGAHGSPLWCRVYRTMRL
ncbi:MAG: hypothetical protein VX228_06860 [Pseudomonadota bacterium]|nr:hypothetical protein [Pseudomonadota bacterium]